MSHDEALMNARWCDVCKLYHGTLYVCDGYSEELKQKLRDDANRMRDNFRNADWVRDQVDGGIGKDALRIMAMFFGVEANEEKLT